MSFAPRCVIFAGPNGSGKSTLVHQSLADTNLDIPHRFINADDIARDLTTGTQLEKEKAAFRQARQLREAYRSAGLSFSFETVFSHPSTLLDLIKLREAGYVVAFIFVATEDVEINVTRVAGRVRTGGHDVPTDKIRSRYERAFQFLPAAAEIANETFVWDNSLTLKPVCIASNGIAVKTVDCTPFYKTHFLIPFNSRRQERADLLVRYPKMQTPEIKSGIYNGQIVEARTHFCVQFANGGAVLHDRTLLTSEPPVDQTVQIAYRDGYGTTQSAGDGNTQP